MQLLLSHRHSYLHPADLITHGQDFISTLCTTSDSSVTRKVHWISSAFLNQGESGATQNILQHKLKGTMQLGISFFPRLRGDKPDSKTKEHAHVPVKYSLQLQLV